MLSQLACPSCQQPKPSKYIQPHDILECNYCNYSGSSHHWLKRDGSPLGDLFDLPRDQPGRPQQAKETHHQPLKFIMVMGDKVARRVGYTILKIQINWF
jgi:hypothetical protein